MKCDVRHICILKKMANGRLSTPLFPPVAGSNFSTGSYTELTFQLLSLFTLLNALSFNSFAGLEKATIIKHLQNVSLVPPFQLFPAMSSCLFKKKLSCGLEMMMCYVLFCIQKLDLVSYIGFFSNQTHLDVITTYIDIFRQIICR